MDAPLSVPMPRPAVRPSRTENSRLDTPVSHSLLIRPEKRGKMPPPIAGGRCCGILPTVSGAMGGLLDVNRDGHPKYNDMAG